MQNGECIRIIDNHSYHVTIKRQIDDEQNLQPHNEFYRIS